MPDKKSPRGWVIGLAVGCVAAGALGSAALARDAAPRPQAVSAGAEAGAAQEPGPSGNATTHRDLSAFPVPDGYTQVGDHDGNVVGYVRTSDIDIATSTFPHLELKGRATKLRGVPVVDGQKQLVGYEVVQLGFIDLAEAGDPDALEARLAELDQITQDYLDTRPEPTIPSEPEK